MKTNTIEIILKDGQNMDPFKKYFQQNNLTCIQHSRYKNAFHINIDFKNEKQESEIRNIGETHNIKVNSSKQLEKLTAGNRHLKKVVKIMEKEVNESTQ